MDPNLRPQVSRPPSAGVPHQGPPPPLSNLPQYQIPSPYGVPQPHTLPPLQHPQTHSPVPHSYMNQPYRNDMHRYPATTANDVYGVSSAAVPPHSGVNMPPSFLGGHHAPPQHYQPHNMMPPNTTAQAYPQLIAPAPPRDRRPEYGMPPGPYSHPENKAPMWATTDTMPPTTAAYLPKEPPRTQVVGSQGRRGILPSVPGRPNAVGNGVNGTAKTTTAPVKDADGKFPCPHCNKTYLHAKHLKRHLLRHTGDRPYMCVLCKDTFSRSDILKRHFQKCSLRRGNPTGVSHLSHPHAHLKRAQAAGVVPKPVQGDVSSSIPTSNGLVGQTFGEGPVNGVAASHQPRFAEHQHLGGYPMHQVNGLNRGPHDPVYAHNQTHQRTSWMPEPKQNSYLMQSGTDTVGQLNVDLPPIDQKPPTAPDSKRPVMPTGHGPNHTGEIDWSSMLQQPGGQENYMNPVMAPQQVNDGPPMHGQVENPDRKYYPAVTNGHQENSGLNGLYLASTSLGGDGMLGSYPFWNFDSSQFDTRTNGLIDFCFPSGLQETSKPRDNDIGPKECLTTDNVKLFFDMFASYHGHWPLLHIPTFDLSRAYDGLIMAICCAGAVYSDCVSSSQVRRLVDNARAAVERTSRILQVLQSPDSETRDNIPEFLFPSDIQEMQAMFILHTLAVWHGTAKQRAMARGDIALFARFVRRFGLLSPSGPDNPECYSPFHNMPSGDPDDANDWDWRVWVEQETRSRLVYMFYMFDTCQVLYFNSPPHFNPQDIKLPLPCDDAVWEAQDSQQCAEALGLMGKDIQATANITGCLRLRQVELHYALSALQSPTVDIRTRSTNVYGKFVLIHALLEQIWLSQRQLYYEKSDRKQDFHGEDFTATTLYNPMLDDSWNTHDATPPPCVLDFISPALSVDVSLSHPSDANVILQSARRGLKKWKRMWDEDTAIQYRPTSHRFGLCRDAVQFYWLGQSLLRSKRMDEWRLDPDTRVKHVFTLLKRTRTIAQADVAKRGERLGSVSEVDDGFAIDDLTYDMKRLFRPIVAAISINPNLTTPNTQSIQPDRQTETPA